MDFNNPNVGLVTPMSPPKNALPAEDDEPWDMEKMTIGPAKTIRPGSPNPMEVVAPGDAGLALLASQLHWEV